MSEMVERVARALKANEDEAPQGGFGTWEAWEPLARAAIEAVRDFCWERSSDHNWKALFVDALAAKGESHDA